MAESAEYAEQCLLKAAVVSSHRLVLYRLGFQLGIMLWQDAWRRSISPPPPPPPQPTPNPAALVSALTDATQTAPLHSSLHPVLDHLLASVNSPLPNGSSQLNFDSSNNMLSPMQTDATAAGTEAAPEAASETAASCSQGAQQCMGIVEAIRREEFGIGVELDAASSLLRHRQNERIGRALQRLSQELYSKDTHFVLELVQNADDNSYASGVLPALEFILQDTGVTVLNNEVSLSCSQACCIQICDHACYSMCCVCLFMFLDTATQLGRCHQPQALLHAEAPITATPSYSYPLDGSSSQQLVSKAGVAANFYFMPGWVHRE